MDERVRQEPTSDGVESVDSEPRVRAHQSRPGRVVLTQEGNTDAWIATDLTVEPEP